MTDQKPLAEALQKYLAVPVSRLPCALRKRIEQAFFPFRWSDLSPNQRLLVAEQSDYQTGPEYLHAQRLWWDHLESIERINIKIQKWEKLTAVTVAEEADKEMHIQRFKEEISRLEAKVSATGDADNLSDGGSSATEVGTPEWRKKTAKAAAEALHGKPGGSRDKKRQIQEIWASGKFTTKQLCAEQECAALGMSFDAARRALVNR